MTTTVDRGRAGARLPDVTLPALDGAQVNLSELTGKRTLLFFWGSW